MNVVLKKHVMAPSK